MKDLFSQNSQLYKQARPDYPHSVIHEILKHTPEHSFAWDCGAGSGQFTQLLVPYFEQIVATDLSESQLQSAPYFENVSYQIQIAEQTIFTNQSFDLITVAQAIHWFDFEKFYAEVRRTLKVNGLLAVVGYGLLEIQDQQVNTMIQALYYEKLAGCWDAERRYIDEAYQTIPFDFDEITVPKFSMTYQWTAAQLLKYLSTWSAIKNYQDQYAEHALLDLAEYLQDLEQKFEITFPVFLRLGRVKK
ncbi:class I SAM-dependent methyltransferase [Acinetobacter sp. TY2]|uniref:class I SAM-dependent methyltransferase n=1 Tax=Acinetobacter sp. TY2 TaxID=3387403 RepID=UPI00391796DD